MIDLTASSDFLRRSSLWIMLSIAGFILLVILYMYSGTIKKALFPPPPPPPTVAFSKLPKLDPNIGYKAPQGEYSLQTVSGELPSLPTSAKVFKIEKNKPSFGSTESLKNRAQSLGFTKEPDQINGSEMKFLSSTNNSNRLTVDSLTGNLFLESDYLTNTKTLSTRPKNIEEAKNSVNSFFTSAGLNFSNYPQSKIETRYWTINAGNLVEANSLSTANVVEVIYRHGDLDKMPIITAKNQDTSVSAIVAQNNVVSAKINDVSIAKNSFASYPLKTPSEAFEQLKSGNASSNHVIAGNSFTVTSVTLGYVLGQQQPQYLQPYYLFKLSSGVFAYVGAVDSRWTN